MVLQCRYIAFSGYTIAVVNFVLLTIRNISLCHNNNHIVLSCYKYNITAKF